jgi:uncharacterized GH25 family protein
MAGLPCSDRWTAEYAHKRGHHAVSPVRSSDDGTFIIRVPTVDKFDVFPDRLWAFSPGHSVAICPIPDSQREQASVRLVLGPASTFRVKVMLPDGKPAQNATLMVSALGIKTDCRSVEEGERFFPPDMLVARTTATTDEHGIAAFPAWRHCDILRVDVVTPTLGRQSYYSRWFPDRRPSKWDIKLMPAGQLRGRVVADGPYPVHGLTVHVKTMSEAADWSYTPREYVDGPQVLSFLSSEATATTDSQGRFEIPVIAHGWVNFDIPNGLNKPYQYLKPDQRNGEQPPEFRQGNKSELVFRLRKAVNVYGTLVLNGTNKRPSQFRIACAETHKSQWFDHSVAFLVDIDDGGKFSFYSLPGEGWLSVRTRERPVLDYVPLSWVNSMGLVSDVKEPEDVTLNYLPGWAITVPQDVAKWDCGSVEVGQVYGRVVTEGGTPIPKATIDVDGNGIGSMVGDLLRYHRVADDKGRFCVWIEYFPLRIEESDSVDGVIVHKNKRDEVQSYTFRFDAGPKVKKYACQDVQWSPKEHRDGVMPDVVLPLRQKESRKENR